MSARVWEVMGSILSHACAMLALHLSKKKIKATRKQKMNKKRLLSASHENTNVRKTGIFSINKFKFLLTVP